MFLLCFLRARRVLPVISMFFRFSSLVCLSFPRHLCSALDAVFTKDGSNVIQEYISGLIAVVSVLQKMVPVNNKSMLSMTALLQRSMKTIISGKYPARVQVSMSRNVIAAFLFRGR